MIVFNYTIKAGKHRHKQFVLNFFKSLFSPVWRKVKRTWVRVDLDPKFKENLTPEQVPGQKNKVYGYALLMLPHWYSIRLTAVSCDGYVEWWRYEYVKGRRIETRLRRKEEDLNLFMFDLEQFRYRMPRHLRWLPMFRIHSYFGGELPAPVEIDNKVTDL